MTRAAAIAALLEALREELGLAIRAARDAGEYATDDEARAETQWDTQGLESSYLAAGQSAQADAIARAVQELERLSTEAASGAAITLGSLVRCELGGGAEWFLLVPARGGASAEVAGEEVTAITAESPLGQALLGCGKGDRFQLPNGTAGRVLQLAG